MFEILFCTSWFGSPRVFVICVLCIFGVNDNAIVRQPGLFLFHCKSAQGGMLCLEINVTIDHVTVI